MLRFKTIQSSRPRESGTPMCSLTNPTQIYTLRVQENPYAVIIQSLTDDRYMLSAFNNASTTPAVRGTVLVCTKMVIPVPPLVCKSRKS